VTNFIGFENLTSIDYETKRGEETRCHFCQNKCVRTFVELRAGERKYTHIIAPCEKGEVLTKDELRKLMAERSKQKQKFPNFVELSNKLLFSSYNPPAVVRSTWRDIFRKKKLAFLRRARVGIPRVLNTYGLAPFFRTYLEALGVRKVIFSPPTSEELYRKGAKRGSIDPCFPSKVALAHTHHLLYEEEVDIILFPCVRTLPPELRNAEGHWACPTVSATPEVVKASFTTEEDEFRKRGVLFLNPVLDFEDEELLERQLYETFSPVFGITRAENREAVRLAFGALSSYKENLRRKAKEVLETLEEEKRVGVLILGRPYHNDPGLNHGIPEEINKLGYPVFTIDSLPRDEETLTKLFGSEKDPLDISDEWKKCYSENSSLKVWGAKFASLHPNLAVVDLSSFRCGHDAPIYSLVDEILRRTKTPYFTFHELDENKPSGSIKIRVETIDYFLKLYESETLRGGGA